MVHAAVTVEIAIVPCTRSGPTAAPARSAAQESATINPAAAIASSTTTPLAAASPMEA